MTMCTIRLVLLASLLVSFDAQPTIEEDGEIEKETCSSSSKTEEMEAKVNLLVERLEHLNSERVSSQSQFNSLIRRFGQLEGTLTSLQQKSDCIPKLLLHNVDGSDFFNRTWDKYKTGFGNPLGLGNYWAGLEEMHRLTATGKYKLRIDAKTRDSRRWYLAEYTTFQVGTEATNYTLTVGGFSGTARYDAFGSWNHNGMQFSTYDRDNDRSGGENCASWHGGGFWYNRCGYFHPTARNRADRWVVNWYRLEGSNKDWVEMSTVSIC